MRSSNLELVTIVECVAADGGFLSPGIIFEGKQQYERAWFEVDPRISIGLSNNGWTSDFHCLEWFKNNFIPQAKARNTSGRPILLVYDGHGSHERYNLLQLAKDHNIILFSLPPHTTHKLQPLDVGVFGPFAHAWIDRCNDYMEEHMDEIPKDQLIKHYTDSGVWPINHNLFMDADFAPSVHTSSTARDVPNSYPVHVDELSSCQSSSDDDLDHESNDDSNHNENESHAAPSSYALESAGNATPIPPSRFYSNAPAPAHRGRNTEAYILALVKENSALRQENEELATHATLAFDHETKYRITMAQFRRGVGGVCRRQEAEEKAKLAEKQARDKERQVEEKEQQRQREQRGPDEPFVGALNSRKKADLQDIAYALGLNIEGRVEDLKSRIKAYFDEHELLHTAPRYIGLFPQLARQAHQIPAQTSQTLSHSESLRNVTNTQQSSSYQHNHITELAFESQVTRLVN
ncbi:hypothetical protein M378DRAFT_17371 [Amanita muscaria Koide BX008]|uniref:DDE-1 domain-containing protein n=1 Tax=Amanita muscaria (strain Koide BX008) TaxID=946122 RepID=A0A0C2W4S5_AMAMK|nr:hypothetical protein M378DRAFT_17371 [Amanita muscaria Koide BX008]